MEDMALLCVGTEWKFLVPVAYVADKHSIGTQAMTKCCGRRKNSETKPFGCKKEKKEKKGDAR